ncbi:histidine phosphatase family protein [Winogradskyella vincentii]|uniref:Nuclear transport factor 2 family protein n=1 Tax=Winogradskyella vincentii TaxID=2877122 RepID=A0ABS7XYQ9_9FLAO|nr:histidine phosphatase family protein [Winogradskyella vincentii]MCA0152799.1 nuclear transport factor 2 family protein [Winogradskyella vincentii]
MKSFLTALLLMLSISIYAQNTSDKTQIETTLNNYIDAFYKGDTTKLKLAIKPRLNKFGYWKNKESGNYEYYAHMSYEKAMEFVQKMKDEGKTRDENKIRNVEVLDIGNHVASAKVTAAWGIDYVQLSKDNGQWMIEQVIWEGPYEKAITQKISTYYLIRHAEKDQSDKSNRNPHLKEKGIERAKNWSNILKDVKFDAVYSTDYHRTKETAMPTANANNLELKFYDPRNMNIENFRKDTNGKTVLIVGHSNTTPMFTNGLIGEKKYKMIDESNNANLYIVTISKDSKTSTLLKVD